MKPILILQNANNDWADYFEDFLRRQAVPYQVINIGQGQILPNTLDAFSGFGLMGGAMGANDEFEHPHLRRAFVLLQQAIAHKIPVIGHCLGGQMLAKAFGAQVRRAPLSEVGWHRVAPTGCALAHDWLGNTPFMAMQWHYDTFDLPAHSTLLASSVHCRNQAFVVDELFVGMQFHIEAQAPKIDTWLADVRSADATPNGINCHDDARIQADTQAFAAQARTIADQLYGKWLKLVIA